MGSSIGALRPVPQPRVAEPRVASPAIATPRASRVEPLLVASVTVCVGMIAGVLMAAGGSVPGAATAHLHQLKETLSTGVLPDSLARPGQPVLYTVLMMPAALLDHVMPAKYMLALPSALAGGAIAATLDGAQRARRVSLPLRLIATAVAVLNPVSVYLMGSGLPTLPAAACVLVGLYALIEWARAGELRSLLFSSLLFSAAALIWYPALVWTLGAFAVVVAVSLLARDGARGATGALILYAFPILAGVGLWTLAVVRATGQTVPWLSQTPVPGTEIVMSTTSFLILTVPCAIAAVIALIAMASRRPRSQWMLVAGLILVPFAVAVLRRIDIGGQVGIGTMFFLLLPFAAVLVAAIVHGELRRRQRVAVYSLVAALLIASSAVGLLWITDSPSPVEPQPSSSSVTQILSGVR
jgi:hypothetical protein